MYDDCREEMPTRKLANNAHESQMDFFYSMSRESAAQSRTRRDGRENAIVAHHSFGGKQ